MLHFCEMKFSGHDGLAVYTVTTNTWKTASGPFCITAFRDKGDKQMLRSRRSKQNVHSVT